MDDAGWQRLVVGLERFESMLNARKTLLDYASETANGVCKRTTSLIMSGVSPLVRMIPGQKPAAAIREDPEPQPAEKAPRPPLDLSCSVQVLRNDGDDAPEDFSPFGAAGSPGDHTFDDLPTPALEGRNVRGGSDDSAHDVEHNTPSCVQEPNEYMQMLLAIGAEQEEVLATELMAPAEPEVNTKAPADDLVGPSKVGVGTGPVGMVGVGGL
jgi:hypothetical protein